MFWHCWKYMVYTVYCIFSLILDAVFTVKMDAFFTGLYHTEYTHFSIWFLVKNGCFLAELQICYVAYSRVPIAPKKKRYAPLLHRRLGATRYALHAPHSPAAAERKRAMQTARQPYIRMARLSCRCVGRMHRASPCYGQPKRRITPHIHRHEKPQAIENTRLAVSLTYDFNYSENVDYRNSWNFDRQTICPLSQ